MGRTVATVSCLPSSHLCSAIVGRELSKGLPYSQQDWVKLVHLWLHWLEHLQVLPSLPNCCSSHNVFIPGCPGAAAI